VQSSSVRTMNRPSSGPMAAPAELPRTRSPASPHRRLLRKGAWVSSPDLPPILAPWSRAPRSSSTHSKRSSSPGPNRSPASSTRCSVRLRGAAGDSQLGPARAHRFYRASCAPRRDSSATFRLTRPQSRLDRSRRRATRSCRRSTWRSVCVMCSMAVRSVRPYVWKGGDVTGAGGAS